MLLDAKQTSSTFDPAQSHKGHFSVALPTNGPTNTDESLLLYAKTRMLSKSFSNSGIFDKLVVRNQSWLAF